MAKSKSKDLPAVWEVESVSLEALEEKRQAVIMQAVEEAPKVVAALVKEAQHGNVAAARLVLEVAGLLNRQGVLIAQQANAPVAVISPEEIRELEKTLLQAKYGNVLDTG